MIILFLISLSSFCYQALAAKSVYLYLQDDSLAFAIVSTLFFFGMARGCQTYWFIKKTYADEIPKYFLVSNELSVVFCASLVGIYLSSAPLLVGSIQFYFSRLEVEQAQILAALPGLMILNRLGFYLGRELTFIYGYLEKQLSEKLNKIGFAIACTYLGSLVASLFCVFWFFRQVNPIQYLSVPTVLNLFLVIYLLKIFYKDLGIREKIFLAIKSTLAVGLLIFFALSTNRLLQKSKSIVYNVGGNEQMGSLSQYFASIESKIQIVSRASPFQVADWVTYYNQPPFSRLYLDGAFQFDSIDEAGYHDPFWHGGIYFSHTSPKKILIMGGGDALLAAAIFKDTQSRNEFDITLVELDQMIPELAYNYWHSLEQNALRRIHLQLSDAFDFIRSRHQQWQAIFLDFPDPRSADLSKLYSVEFYRMVRRNLSQDGFIVLDYPAKNSAQIIFATLKAAGFTNIVLYGKGNTFVYADQRNRTDEELKSLKVLSPYKVIPVPHFDPSQVNSIFNLRLPEEQSFQLLQAWWQRL